MATNLTLAARIRGSLVGLAVCDALGGPVEFKSRGSFPKVTTMLPNDNFGLPAGCFTDDTSMALCLARSLLDAEGKSSPADQAGKYLAWWQTGYMSCTGACFDIGVSNRASLARWSAHFGQHRYDILGPGSELAQEIEKSGLSMIAAVFNKDNFCGNGSLMRVVPAALMSRNPEGVVSLGRSTSLTTHPHARCVEACGVYSDLVWRATAGESKESLCEAFAKRISQRDIDPVLRERLSSYNVPSAWTSTPDSSIRSTGYVIDSLEAALWSFFITSSFEEGAIKAVNLGDDADTIGAIYGGLAGAYYGCQAIPAKWFRSMMRTDLVNDIANEILAFRGLDAQLETKTSEEMT